MPTAGLYVWHSKVAGSLCTEPPQAFSDLNRNTGTMREFSCCIHALNCSGVPHTASSIPCTMPAYRLQRQPYHKSREGVGNSGRLPIVAPVNQTSPTAVSDTQSSTNSHCNCHCRCGIPGTILLRTPCCLEPPRAVLQEPGGLLWRYCSLRTAQVNSSTIPLFVQ
jgi:hypothetical protein